MGKIDLFVDEANWWDILAKPKIKEFYVCFSRQRNDNKKFLLSYLKIAYQNSNWEEVVRIKEELNVMLKADAYGFIVRSRHNQNVEEEAASLYHAANEVRSNRNNIPKLKIEDRVVTDPKIIEGHVVHFFNALFNGHHDQDLVDTGVSFVPDNSFLAEMLSGLTSMDKADSEKMHSDIDMEELDEIITKCPNNKSPGLDGLCYEFYKVTWPIIRSTFIRVLQCQLDRCSIISSNREGVTRLLPKVSGVPTVTDLRPVTLLNCDYRILSKFLVKRMKPVLPSVIRSGQLCTVGRRNILFGTSNILSSISYIKQKNLKACLVSLDFYKAYVRVLISFLLKVLHKMGFSATSWSQN